MSLDWRFGPFAHELRLAGVETLFAIPGIQLDGILNALWEACDHLREIHACRYGEWVCQGTGRDGVAVVSPGPGLLNTTATLSTAYPCDSPVLIATGQIRSDLLDAGAGALHEIPDQIGMIGSVTKHAGRPGSVEVVPSPAGEAFR